MSAFLKYLLTVVIATSLLVYLAQRVLNGGFNKQQNEFFATMNYVLKDNNNHPLIAIGASTTRNNLDVRVLDSLTKINCFNAGVYAFGFSECKMLLECYLNSEHPKPKRILLTLPENLAARPYEIAFPAQFYPYLNEEPVYHTISQYDEDIRIIKKVPAYALTRYSDHLKYVALIPYVKPNHAKPGVYKGFEPLEGVFASSGSKPWVETKASSAKQIALLDNLCDYCVKHNIAVTLISPPVYTHHLITNSPLMEDVKVIQKKYGLKLLDFSHDSMCVDNSYFFDRMHLNSRGAKIFTAKVARNL